MYEDVLDKVRCRYLVEPVPFAFARDFVRAHHYSKGSANTMTAGYVLKERMPKRTYEIGVLMFQTPNSEAVRASIFGPDHKAHVTELHRLVILDVTPANTESWFIARCLGRLKRAKPHLWGILSFADPAHGHRGVIYQAGNAAYSGMTAGGGYKFVDPEGRIRHRRQCGHNVTAAEAAEKGWKRIRDGAKHRYAFMLPDGRSHRRQLFEMYRFENQPYPRPDCTNNGAA